MATLSTTRREIPGEASLRTNIPICFDDLPFAVGLINHIGAVVADRAGLAIRTNENGVINGLSISSGDPAVHLPLMHQLNKLCGDPDAKSLQYDAMQIAKMKQRFVPGKFID